MQLASDVIHPLPLDPTLTVDNVSHLMEKVEPEERQRVLKEILGGGSMFHNIQSSLSTNLEDAVAVDIFVNCKPEASWERLASSLYHCHQVAAVEEVRQYLPPRGEFWNVCFIASYKDAYKQSCSLEFLATFLLRNDATFPLFNLTLAFNVNL